MNFKLKYLVDLNQLEYLNVQLQLQYITDKLKHLKDINHSEYINVKLNYLGDINH